MKILNANKRQLEIGTVSCKNTGSDTIKFFDSIPMFPNSHIEVNAQGGKGEVFYCDSITGRIVAGSTLDNNALFTKVTSSIPLGSVTLENGESVAFHSTKDELFGQKSKTTSLVEIYNKENTLKSEEFAFSEVKPADLNRKHNVEYIRRK